MRDVLALPAAHRVTSGYYPMVTRRTTSTARRDGILTAARELFFSKGYHGTTIETIARRAGYSKRTVYLDFQNKDELAISVGAEGLELLLSKLRNIPIAELSVDECIDRFVDVYLDFSRKHSAYFRLIFGESTPEMVANCCEEVRRRMRDLERACLSGVVSWAERAVAQRRIAPVDPLETAGMFVGSATGIILLTMGGSQTVFTRKRLRQLVRRAVLMMWEGMQACARKEDIPRELDSQ